MNIEFFQEIIDHIIEEPSLEEENYLSKVP